MDPSPSNPPPWASHDVLLTFYDPHMPLYALYCMALVLPILFQGPPSEHELHSEVAQHAADDEDIEEGEDCSVCACVCVCMS